MKFRVTKMFFAAFIAIAAVSAQAATETVNGITWTYTFSNGGVSVGGGSSSSPAVPKTTSGAITIPSTLGGYPVTSIGDYAFNNCSSLTSVTIPDSVASIGYHAFYGCSSLKAVYITDLAKWCKIDFDGYESTPLKYAQNLYLKGELIENLVIPDGVTSIKDYTFYGCDSFKSVTIPDGVTSIGYEAFRYCSSLMSVTMSDSLTSIGHGAFYCCSSLTSVTIPNSVTSIESSAFSGCGSLTSVMIGNSLTSIGDYVFSDCRSLTSVTMPNSVMRIGESAFSGCSSLTSVVIPDSVTSIGYEAFFRCGSLTSIAIPDSVTSIGDRAFSGCSSLTNVMISQLVCKSTLSSVFPSSYQSITDVVILEGVERVGASLFSGCSSLTSVTIPDSVTNIGEAAFAGCNAALYNRTTIPGVILVDGWAVGYEVPISQELDLTGVRGVGISAFSGCSTLTSVMIPDSVTSIGSSAFYNCSSLTSVAISQLVCESKLSSIFPSSYQSITNVVILEGVERVGASLFSDCRSLTSVMIPDGVTSIGSRAFYNCNMLKEVSFPSSITSVGFDAFSGCLSLESVYITDIASWCRISFYSQYSHPFVSAKNLYLNGERVVNLVIPDGVEYIGDNAFCGYECLESVVIPNSVTNIGDNAFNGCKLLQRIEVPGSVKVISGGVFAGCESLKDIIFNEGLEVLGVNKSWYISDSFGSRYWSLRPVFYGCSSLQSIKIPSSVTNIQDQAFSGCSSLKDILVPQCVCDLSLSAFFPESYAFVTNLVIAEGVTNLASNAFSGCSSLKNIQLPSTLKSIKDNAFSQCNGLIELVLPSSVKDVYDGAFLNCTSLTNVIIEEGVVNLGMSLTSTGGVFEGCTSLEYMSIPATVKSIGTRVFYGCSSLANVAIPHGVKVIGDDAFSGCEALESIEVPGSVDFIGDRAFMGCILLKDVKINEGVKSIGMCSKFYESIPSNGNTILVDGSTLGDLGGANMSSSDGSQVLCGEVSSTGVFEGCLLLNSLVIPNTVTNIGDRTFACCTSLKNITLPAALKSIGHQAFYKCTSLADIFLPNELSYMGFGVFAECSLLKDIEIPGTLEDLLDGLFYNCTSLTNVLINEGVKRLGWGSWCDSVPTKSHNSSVLGGDSCYAGYALFENCVALNRFVIPSTVSWIDGCAFAGCSSIKDLTISNYLLQEYGLTIFPSYRDIEKLKITGQSEDLENGRGKIVFNYGFNDCVSLRDVEIAEGMVGLEGTFDSCSSVEYVKLPSTLSWIEGGFYMAGSLKSVVFAGDAPDLLWEKSFYGTPRRLVFSVPEGSIGWNGGISEGIPTTWLDRQIVSYVPENQPGSGQNPSVPGDDITKPTENSYFLTVTNVVVHYVLNSVQSEIALPVGDSTGYVNVITEVTSGGAVSIPSEWKDNFEGFEAKFGNDFGKALMKPTGKVDGAGNAMLVWQDYVAGTNPMNPNDKFMASVTIVDGKPIVSWTPELPEDQAALRSYTIYGKTKLQDAEWSKVSGDEANYNFFKVVVEMK